MKAGIGTHVSIIWKWHLKKKEWECALNRSSSRHDQWWAVVKKKINLLLLRIRWRTRCVIRCSLGPHYVRESELHGIAHVSHTEFYPNRKKSVQNVTKMSLAALRKVLLSLHTRSPHSDLIKKVSYQISSITVNVRNLFMPWSKSVLSLRQFSRNLGLPQQLFVKNAYTELYESLTNVLVDSTMSRTDRQANERKCST